MWARLGKMTVLNTVTFMARWDIFCTVVDNYGDIGVAWRLARQLAQEKVQEIRLWVDDLQVFQRLCPMIDPNEYQQERSGVTIMAWTPECQPTDVADIVIEMFACSIPEVYRRAMQDLSPVPMWVNLEYLTAEKWIGDCHLLPSLQPDGLSKFFFFPGFQEPSGGLLRETKLDQQKKVFQRAPRALFLKKLGLALNGGERLVSLFSYEQKRLGDWLDVLANDAQRTLLLVPQGKVSADVARWAGQAAAVTRGALQVWPIPFLDQEGYDQLLWTCDVNMVRGEDSFVRAQWAGAPFIWQIYPQMENAHWPKLEAFLDLYVTDWPPHMAEALQAFMHFWNGEGEDVEAWRILSQYDALWRQLSEKWCENQTRRSDLATRLVQFCLNSLS